MYLETLEETSVEWSGSQSQWLKTSLRSCSSGLPKELFNLCGPSFLSSRKEISKTKTTGWKQSHVCYVSDATVGLLKVWILCPVNTGHWSIGYLQGDCVLCTYSKLWNNSCQLLWFCVLFHYCTSLLVIEQLVTEDYFTSHVVCLLCMWSKIS